MCWPSMVASQEELLSNKQFDQKERSYCGCVNNTGKTMASGHNKCVDSKPLLLANGMLEQVLS